MKDSSLLNAALEYIRRGKLVFPCGMDKKPLVKGGFKSASLNSVQIREWRQRWPDAMIGMPTGQINGVLAVDCDGETGVQNFLSLCEQEGVAPDTTWQITPGEVGITSLIARTGHSLLYQPACAISGYSSHWRLHNLRPIKA